MKKTIALLICCLFLSLTIIPCYGSTNSENTLKNESIDFKEDTTDSDQFEYLIKNLFSLCAEIMVSPEKKDIDFSVFWNKDSENYNNLVYFERNAFAKGMRDSFNGNTIYWCEAKQKVRSLTISNYSAHASVAAQLCYESKISKSIDPDVISKTGGIYEIDFIRINNDWLIDNIDFYDESTELLRDPNISMDEYLSHMISEPSFVQKLWRMEMRVGA